MELVAALLAAFAFGAAARKKGRDGLKAGAGIAAILTGGLAAIGFYGQAARLEAFEIDAAATWYWLALACTAAGIYLYNLDDKTSPTHEGSNGISEHGKGNSEVDDDSGTRDVDS